MKPMLLRNKDDETTLGSNFINLQQFKAPKPVESFKEDKVKVQIIPEKKSNAITFQNFINFFPEVDLPYTITSDTQRMLSINNDPMSATWMFNFVLGENDTIDDCTEFMPCFSLANTQQFIAIVFWQAGIEGSAYYLTTFSKTGVLIDQAKIAGTKYGSDGLYQMVCTISPNWLFSTVEGKLDEKGQAASVSESEKHQYKSLQLSGDGEIVPI
jgi:hypothetical protein